MYIIKCFFCGLIIFHIAGCNPKGKSENLSIRDEDSIEIIEDTPKYKGTEEKQAIIDSCTINISQKNLKKEYSCSMFLFKHKSNIIYVDSNFDYCIYYSPIINYFNSLKAFELYDSPTGRKKLLLFNTDAQRIFVSNWFDDSAIGDSIDIKSISLETNDFRVWTNKNNIQKSYLVKLNSLKSW